MLNRWILIIGGLIMAIGIAAFYVLRTPGSQGDASQPVMTAAGREIAGRPQRVQGVRNIGLPLVLGSGGGAGAVGISAASTSPSSPVISARMASRKRSASR